MSSIVKDLRDAFEHRPLFVMTLAFLSGIVGTSGTVALMLSVGCVLTLLALIVAGNEFRTVIVLIAVGGYGSAYEASQSKLPPPKTGDKVHYTVRVSFSSQGSGRPIIYGRIVGRAAVKRIRITLAPRESRRLPEEGDLINVAGIATLEGDRIGLRPLSPLQPVEQSGVPGVLDLWSVHFRHSIAERLDHLLPGEHSSVALAILVGDRRSLPRTLEDSFSETGTYHLLATAGLHLGIWLWLFNSAVSGVLNQKQVDGTLLIAVGFFGLIAGPRPAVLRAVLVATIHLIGRLIGRIPDAPTSIAAAALLICAWDPLVLFEPGFQLSFVTVMAIILGMPGHPLSVPDKSMTRPSRVFKCILNIARLSFWAQIGSGIVTAVTTRSWATGGFFANLMAVPLLMLIYPLTIAMLLIDLVLPSIAALLADWLVLPMVELLIGLVEWFSIHFPEIQMNAVVVILGLVTYLVLWGGRYLCFVADKRARDAAEA